MRWAPDHHLVLEPHQYQGVLSWPAMLQHFYPLLCSVFAAISTHWHTAVRPANQGHHDADNPGAQGAHGWCLLPTAATVHSPPRALTDPTEGQLAWICALLPQTAWLHPTGLSYQVWGLEVSHDACMYWDFLWRYINWVYFNLKGNLKSQLFNCILRLKCHSYLFEYCSEMPCCSQSG